jgi:hypothetical protein
MTKEQAASIATKVLLNLYAESMPSVARIVNAEAEIRNGNEEGYTTLCDALTGAKEFIQDLLDAMGKGLWHDAVSDDLPPIDEKVIVLDFRGKISFAHRPNPDGFDGKSIATGKIEHYGVVIHGKGGWNIPNVRWWMPCPPIPEL